MKKSNLLLTFILLTALPMIGFSQMPNLNCKPQSWKEFDMSAPTYSGQTLAERKQSYCDSAIKEIDRCFASGSQMQPSVIIDAEKWQKKQDKASKKNERRKAKIRKKYCSGLK